jgi:leucyl-tRNA synthetase
VLNQADYNHIHIQQSYSAESDLKTKGTGAKFYCLSMFPYPSGDLHMGHVRNYTLGDVISRYHHIRGYQVFQPMGWDAFGLPAENAAIKHQKHPMEWTLQNISRMRKQMEEMAWRFDWDHELATIYPEYYRHQQWLFLKMYEQGLVYRKKSIVNWDPVDQTVLANEQVIDGKGWRSGVPVVQKEIDQWYLKITSYAERLLQGLDQLKNWPVQVKQMQKNWIGRSEGYEIDFYVPAFLEKITVFTTRLDTIMGVSVLVLAYDHPIVQALADHNPNLKNFIKNCEQTTTAEADLAIRKKEGLSLGIDALHPVSEKKIPIWVGNYVLMSYGTGAVMSVPAHDERDYEFAKTHQHEIVQVIGPDTILPMVEKGVLMNSGPYDGLQSDKAILQIASDIDARIKVQYRLRDWGLSRQRYWGCPIPMIHCSNCGIVPEVEKNLPVRLPVDIQFDQSPNLLQRCEEFLKTQCPSCGQDAKRETDTFDTFVDSSWYYLRFPCIDGTQIVDERTKKWGQVDTYVGGIEHAILHLLYARFITKVIFDLGLIEHDEPFNHLLTQGMVLKDGAKMSKSKGNVVAPSDLMGKYGADAIRVFICFAAPPEQNVEWSDSAVAGAYKFLARIWGLSHQLGKHMQNASLEEAKKHSEAMCYLFQIQQDFERNQFNTVISGLMKLTNYMLQTDGMSAGACGWLLKMLLKNLYPFAPQMAFVVLEQHGIAILGDGPMIQIDQAWTQGDLALMVVQINGKKRHQIYMDRNMTQSEIEIMVKNDMKIVELLAGHSIKKCIIVPDRLINLVI